MVSLYPLPYDSSSSASTQSEQTSDQDASKEAIDLITQLHNQSGKGTLFGHQDTSAYGVGWKRENNRSDILDVTGRWPAVYGWDIGGLEHRQAHNLDGVRFDDIIHLIKDADARGGINTISFHQSNPVTGGGPFDNTSAVTHILPGGEMNAAFLAVLDSVADFTDSLRRKDGTRIPIVFRPYHERNQSWPWWGKEACTPEQYIQLWQMTVDYLRRWRKQNQILYCFSPQDIATEEEYLVGYPGDGYVDVLGLDFYAIWNKSDVAVLGKGLSMLNQLAEKCGKVAALTETGLECVPVENWWTAYLLAALETDTYSRRTVWALVWRNKGSHHFFAPYPEHPSVEDFVMMTSHQLVVMGGADKL